MRTCESCDLVKFYRKELAYSVAVIWCRDHEQAEHEVMVGNG